MSRHGARPSLDLLAAVGVATATASAVLLSGLVPFLDAVRIVGGALVVTVIPGYVVSLLVYPRPGRDEHTPVASGRGVTAGERLVLSLAGTLVLVAGTAFVANWTPWGISPAPLAVGLWCLTLAAAGVAGSRRRRQGRQPASLVPGRDSIPVGWFRAATPARTVLNAAVVLSIVIALAGIGYAAVEPPTAERYTEVELVTENASGEWTADDYPRNFTEGQSQPLALRIENHEGQPTAYTAVVTLQRVDTSGASPEVVDAVELDRLHVTVDPGRTRLVRHRPAPTMVGDSLRLQYSIYKRNRVDSPADTAPAYRLHLWINVSASS